jgi:hypothetical protein
MHLLEYFERCGFDGAPRFRGIDSDYHTLWGVRGYLLTGPMRRLAGGVKLDENPCEWRRGGPTASGVRGDGAPHGSLRRMPASLG